MPSLMPGMPGTKEAFGISLVNDDFSVVIPPKAVEHYGFGERCQVMLSTGHRGEGGFACMSSEKASSTVFAKYFERLGNPGDLFWDNGKAYGLVTFENPRILASQEALEAFLLSPGDRLLVVKSTTVAMSFTPVEIWTKKFEQRGLDEAVENMETLEVFAHDGRGRSR